MDLYTPVTSDYAKRNNKFTGKIDKITIALNKMSTPAATEKEIEEKEGEDAVAID